MDKMHKPIDLDTSRLGGEVTKTLGSKAYTFHRVHTECIEELKAYLYMCPHVEILDTTTKYTVFIEAGKRNAGSEYVLAIVEHDGKFIVRKDYMLAMFAGEEYKQDA